MPGTVDLIQRLSGTGWTPNQSHKYIGFAKPALILLNALRGLAHPPSMRILTSRRSRLVSFPSAGGRRAQVLSACSTSSRRPLSSNMAGSHLFTLRAGHRV